jgi:hypothetical protein
MDAELQAQLSRLSAGEVSALRQLAQSDASTCLEKLRQLGFETLGERSRLLQLLRESGSVDSAPMEIEQPHLTGTQGERRKGWERLWH